MVALPLAMALAVAAGASPVSGLYTAAFAGATAATFGGSKFNITGPTAALVPLLAHVSLRYGAAALPLVALMAGVLLILMSVTKVGRLVRFMPLPVIVGFTAGIALSIAFGQLNNLLAVTGTDPSLEHFHEKLADTARHIESLDVPTAIAGVAAIALLAGWARLPRLSLIPGPLVAVLLFTAVSWGGVLSMPTLFDRYGDLSAKFPTPSLSFVDAGLAVDLLPSALAIAVLGAVESLLCAVVAEGMARTAERHDSDRELLGQGLANIVAPIMGGIPATAAIARTGAGIRSGGNSRLVGVIHAVVVLAATLVLSPLASHVPLTVLAAILIFVAWNIADVPEVLGLIKRAPRQDVVVLLATIFITLFLDLTYAIGFGVMASAALLLSQLVKLPAAKALLPDETGRVPVVSEGLSQLMQERPDISFFSAQEVLSFHSLATFEHTLNADLSKPLILRMKDVHHIDTSGLITLMGVIGHRQRHGSRIILSAIQPDLWPVLDRFGVLDEIGRENVFAETRLAIADIDAPLED